MDESDADRKATILFATTILIVAISVGSMLVSGWHAGSLDNRVEWIFWAGAVVGAAGVATLGAATFPAKRTLEGTNRLIRAGLLLFLVAPVLCVFAVMADYWI